MAPPAVIDSTSLGELFQGKGLVISAVQGALVKLEKSLTGPTGGWTVVSEGKSTTGEVRLSAPVDPEEKQAFFRVRLQP